MASIPSLNSLIKLAKDGADKAGKQLGQLTSERNNAETQLSTLHDYRLDYAERLQKATQNGLSASNYHNFRQFIATLDEAISQQNSIVAQMNAKIEQERQQWYAEKRRLNSFEALKTRQSHEQLQRDNRKEQLANDEVSTNLYRRARYSN